jgi:RNA polymerase sigma-70 factor (ECF subfamily)
MSAPPGKRIDPDSFDRLYREFHPRVLAICRHLLGSSDQAEDAANEIFLRLPASLQAYDPAQPFRPWLSKVAGNYCIDLLRKRRSEQRVLQPADPEAPEPPAPLSSPLHKLLGQEEAGVLRDALVSLPEHYFVPLVMRYYSDLSYDEIAEALGTSRTRVAVLIFRAKQKLGRVLAGQGAKRRSGQRNRKQAAGRRTKVGRWLETPAFGLPL